MHPSAERFEDVVGESRGGAVAGVEGDGQAVESFPWSQAGKQAGPVGLYQLLGRFQLGSSVGLTGRCRSHPLLEPELRGRCPFETVAVDQLDAVVRVRIVARGDRDAANGRLAACREGDTQGVGTIPR